MANPLMGNMNNSGMNMGNNPMAMMQKFQEFRKMFSPNANPEQILNNLVSSGKVTNEQVEQAKQMAKQMGLMK